MTTTISVPTLDLGQVAAARAQFGGSRSGPPEGPLSIDPSHRADPDSDLHELDSVDGNIQSSRESPGSAPHGNFAESLTSDEHWGNGQKSTPAQIINPDDLPSQFALAEKGWPKAVSEGTVLQSREANFVCQASDGLPFSGIFQIRGFEQNDTAAVVKETPQASHGRTNVVMRGFQGCRAASRRIALLQDKLRECKNPDVSIITGFAELVDCIVVMSTPAIGQPIKSLQQSLQPLPPFVREWSIKPVIASLCTSLRLMHDQGIVHGSIDPRTVTIHPAGVHLSGFELYALQAAHGQPHRKTKLTEALWRAPEWLRGSKVGVEADVWGIGLIIFYLLFDGRSPGHMVLDDYMRNHPDKNFQDEDVQSLICKAVKKADSFETLSAGGAGATNQSNDNDSDGPWNSIKWSRLCESSGYSSELSNFLRSILAKGRTDRPRLLDILSSKWMTARPSQPNAAFVARVKSEHESSAPWQFPTAEPRYKSTKDTSFAVDGSSSQPHAKFNLSSARSHFSASSPALVQKDLAGTASAAKSSRGYWRQPGGSAAFALSVHTHPEAASVLLTSPSKRHLIGSPSQSSLLDGQVTPSSARGSTAGGQTSARTTHIASAPHLGQSKMTAMSSSSPRVTSSYTPRQPSSARTIGTSPRLNTSASFTNVKAASGMAAAGNPPTSIRRFDTVAGDMTDMLPSAVQARRLTSRGTAASSISNRANTAESSVTVPSISILGKASVEVLADGALNGNDPKVMDEVQGSLAASDAGVSQLSFFQNSDSHRVNHVLCDSGRLYVSYHNGTVKVLDSHNLSLIQKLGVHHGCETTGSAVASGRLFCTGRDSTMQVILMSSWHSTRSISAHRPGGALSVASLGSLVATGGYDCCIRIWDTMTPSSNGVGPNVEMKQEIRSDRMGEVSGLYTSNYQALGLLASHDRTYVRVFDIETGQRRLWLREHEEVVDCMDWVSDPSSNHMLASGDRNGAVKLWDGRQSKWGRVPAVARLACAHESGVTSLVDSTLVMPYTIASAGRDGIVKIWDLRKLDDFEPPLITFRAHQSNVTALCSCTHGIVSAGDEGITRLWSAKALKAFTIQ